MNHFIAQELNNGQGWLNAKESHHATRVLRLSNGAKISVTNGKGKVYLAELGECKAQQQHFTITTLLREEPKPQLHLAVAPTKSNDRFEFFLEKASELGVASITPILCQNSERKVYKTHRGQRVILAAVKQSHKGWIPQLKPMLTFSNYLKNSPLASTYISHLAEDSKLTLKKLDFNTPIHVLIGPEGDFSNQELIQARKLGIHFLNLGQEILRTETAALSVCAARNYQLS
jgi:16S rRNA (uracil1498-N3)-methyltransferase